MLVLKFKFKYFCANTLQVLGMRSIHNNSNIFDACQRTLKLVCVSSEFFETCSKGKYNFFFRILASIWLKRASAIPFCFVYSALTFIIILCIFFSFATYQSKYEILFNISVIFRFFRWCRVSHFSLIISTATPPANYPLSLYPLNRVLTSIFNFCSTLFLLFLLFLFFCWFLFAYFTWMLIQIGLPFKFIWHNVF